MALAAAGVAGWMAAGEPLVATACVVVADLLGAGMMVPKTWRDPGSETLSTYALATVRRPGRGRGRRLDARCCSTRATAAW